MFKSFWELSESGVFCEPEFDTDFKYTGKFANGTALPWYIKVAEDKP